jgi:hypothetical protein
MSIKVSASTFGFAAFILQLTMNSFAQSPDQPRDGTTTKTLKAVERAPAEAFVKEIDRAFAMAQFVRLKFADGEVTDRRRDRLASTDWRYSVTYNCRGTCAAATIKLNRRIASGLRADNPCPGPYIATLELLNEQLDIAEAFEIAAQGLCFSWHGVSYVAVPGIAIGEREPSDGFRELFLLS